MGKIKNLKHFDAEFFHVPPIQANSMDPQLKLLHEVAYEAIVDAGEYQGPVDFKNCHKIRLVSEKLYRMAIILH